MAKAKKPVGRQTVYSQPIADTICLALSEGKSLREICEGEGMPPEATVRTWVVDDREGFAAQYARARNIGLDIRADFVRQAFMAEPDTARARLIFDHERWYLSKLAPKVYGERQQVEHSGNVTLGSLVEASLPKDK